MEAMGRLKKEEPEEINKRELMEYIIAKSFSLGTIHVILCAPTVRKSFFLNSSAKPYDR